MANRLEPINLTDFTGGLNLRANQFQLGENESPEMMNVEIDARGGFFSRAGWQRRDAVPITTGVWNPRSAYIHTLTTGVQVMYLSNEGEIYTATDTGPFTVVAAIPCVGVPHLADFAPWGDVMYVACGATEQSAKRTGTGAMALVPQLTAGTMNDDYTAPVGGRLPSAEHFEVHSGYLFAASTEEDAALHPNRIRWSHPDQPEDWATDDYIDLLADGSFITGIMSFRDHLVIFKEHSMWALYGYDADSWQLIQVSAQIGATSSQAMVKSQTAVYFHSARNSPGIYGYEGDAPVELSESLRVPFNDINEIHNVFMGWTRHRLWVSVPWTYLGATTDAESVFVFDPRVGRGAWSMHSSNAVGALGAVSGAPGPYFAGTRSLAYALACIRGEIAGVIELEANETGFDEIKFMDELGTPAGDTIVTPAGDQIVLVGSSLTTPESYYRTRWLDAGWPTRKKSWRRPDYICREYGGDYDLRVQVFRDHLEAIRRSHTTTVNGSGNVAIWGQFEWGDGTQWGAGESSASIERGSSLGLAKAVQLRFRGPDDQPARWGVDAIVMKYVSRRFR